MKEKILNFNKQEEFPLNISFKSQSLYQTTKYLQKVKKDFNNNENTKVNSYSFILSKVQQEKQFKTYNKLNNNHNYNTKIFNNLQDITISNAEDVMLSLKKRSKISKFNNDVKNNNLNILYNSKNSKLTSTMIQEFLEKSNEMPKIEIFNDDIKSSNNLYDNTNGNYHIKKTNSCLIFNNNNNKYNFNNNFCLNDSLTDLISNSISPIKLNNNTNNINNYMIKSNLHILTLVKADNFYIEKSNKCNSNDKESSKCCFSSLALFLIIFFCIFDYLIKWYIRKYLNSIKEKECYEIFIHDSLDSFNLI